eukprot:TRINITY_DN2491_c0_g1_i1.p1 TRINITY_DN2491_c0_g1~~TRINITY_DN2491_c0_g1_i1.p1  ORF type:complete len:829 (+),score=209.94 TRINITY_DN2491_c0_g1_i1:162-2648(+)
MGILRSEQMKHGTLVLPVDRARYFVDLIGANASMQFEDMNARDMHRPYKKHIQRIDEMERILRFLMEELTRLPGHEVIKNNLQNFLDNADEYKLDDVEAKLKSMYNEFKQFKENNVKLIDRRNAALEERYVVQTAMASMAQVGGSSRARRRSDDGEHFEFSASRSLLDDEEGAAGRRTLETMFSNVAGVIPQCEQERFARMLFRATRGNTFTHFQQIPEPLQDPKTGKEVHKSVFVIYFQDHRIGSSASAMNEKVTKLCGTFGVNTYRWPASREAAEEHRRALNMQVEDQDRLLRAHDAYVQHEAAMLLERTRSGGNSLIEEWCLFCKKEKSIYATLNLFEGNMNLRASCWYPAAEEDQIRAMLIRQSSQQQGHSSAMLVSDRQMPRTRPPTYIRRNEFTGIFQDLVDTYGLPRYGEANPMLFTIVTFPFLFGVMYGDIGHGALLLMVGLWAVRSAPSLKYSVPELYSARYILVMMGFFGMYAGFIYNDFFSVGLNLFGSRWRPGAKEGGLVTYEPNYDIRNEGGPGPYPFGIDPAWHGAQNELIYMNSMKMKLSVILGVAQMIVGLLLRFSNALYEKNMIDFWCECVPMMVFMLCFFGFMDYMIMYKWVTPMENAPSIINSLIAMGMWQDDPNPMFGIGIVRVLMTLTMLTVPVMLLQKPFLLLARQKAQKQRLREGTMSLMDEESQISLDRHDDEAHGEHVDFGEIFIHQVIETIEYVLGTVSHCASYLRLWALSLAHQQLSLVFFEKTILTGMAMAFPLNMFALFILFGVWFGITVGVLMGMDVMECFLHTLRLHWVEFQSKFYRADGYAFVPYRHSSILEDRGE